MRSRIFALLPVFLCPPLREMRLAVKLRIPYHFEPRWYQIPLMNCLDNGFKRACAVWHRRAGKDKCMINIMAREMLRRPGSYYYLFPKQNQGRRVLWEGMDRNGFKHLDHIPMGIRKATHNTEMKIELFNGSIFRVLGTDNFDVSMGTNPVGLVFSEFSLQDPRVWQFFMPILTENEGFAIFNFTPRGRNHAFDLYESAKANPRTWFSQLLTIDDTKAVSKEQIDQIRAEGQMTDAMIAQEFYCDFEASISGAFFQNELKLAQEQGRICKLPIEIGLPVYSFWDLGVRDSTTIWLAQFVGKEVRMVGYYENTGEGLAHYANWLNEWRQKHKVSLANPVLPHDASVRSMNDGKSRVEFLADLGLECDVAPRPSRKEDAVEASRQMIGRTWFDSERCAMGIDHLHKYRAELDEINGVLKSRPVHDRASHCADAFHVLSLWYAEHGGPRHTYSIDEILKATESRSRRSATVYAGYSDPHGGGWMK